jgi:hypothetical protein
MDKATGRQQKITITASSGLSETEIDRMVKEAEKFASEDTKRKEAAEVKNNADSAIFAAEKVLRDFADRLPDDAKRQTQEKIDAARKDRRKLSRKEDDIVPVDPLEHADFRQIDGVVVFGGRARLDKIALVGAQPRRQGILACGGRCALDPLSVRSDCHVRVFRHGSLHS